MAGRALARRLSTRGRPARRVVRFACAERGEARWGIADAETGGADVGDALPVVSEEGVLRGSLEETGTVATVNRILAPVPVGGVGGTPPAVIAAGLNYKGHAEETGKELPRFPIIIWINPASVCGHMDRVCVPKVAQSPLEIDYEVELALVIGGKQACRDVNVEDAMDYVCGFTVANDVSARRWQGKKGGGQWCRAKSWDTFTPLGPSLLLNEESFRGDPRPGLDLWSSVNGRRMQSSNTSDMIFSPAELVSFASQGTTLLPGTVILTGTPEGVGYTRSPPAWLRDQDVVACGIDGIGRIENTVVFE